MSPEDYKYLVILGNASVITITHFRPTIDLFGIVMIILCAAFTIYFAYLNEQYKHTELEEYELYFIPHITHSIFGSMLVILGIYIEPIYMIVGALIMGIGLIITLCAIYNTQNRKYGYHVGKNVGAKYSLIIGSLCFVPIPYVFLYAPKNLVTLSASIIASRNKS